MQKQLKITRIIAIIAFAMYLITMILPYTSDKYYELDDDIYHATNYGYKSDYILFFIFFVPALLFMLLKHSLAMKVLSMISGTLLFGLILLVVYIAFFSWGFTSTKPNIGFYLFLFAGLLMFVASIIKLTVKVPGKKDKQVELLDNF